MIFLMTLLSSVKSFFTAILSNPKSLIILIVVAIAIGGYFKVSSSFKELNKQVATATTENVKLKGDLATITDINNQNVNTIELMKTEKALAAKSVNDLRIQIGRDNKKLEDLRTLIDSYSTKDDGAIAKVLSDTIVSIQKIRKEGNEKWIN